MTGEEIIKDGIYYKVSNKIKDQAETDALFDLWFEDQFAEDLLYVDDAQLARRFEAWLKAKNSGA